jgi:hypothetical protein
MFPQSIGSVPSSCKSQIGRHLLQRGHFNIQVNLPPRITKRTLSAVKVSVIGMA